MPLLHRRCTKTWNHMRQHTSDNLGPTKADHENRWGLIGVFEVGRAQRPGLITREPRSPKRGRRVFSAPKPCPKALPLPPALGGRSMPGGGGLQADCSSFQPLLPRLAPAEPEARRGSLLLIRNLRRSRLNGRPSMLWRVSSRPIRSRCKPPGFILPCQPALAGRPPAGPGCLHEIKFDGYRVIAR
jgi:hypothetical protein